MLDQLIKNHTIIIYDGICGFCNESIQFILKQRPSKQLKFASSQSEIGQQILQLLEIEDALTSIIVIENKRFYKKSKAIFIIMKYLNSPWKYISYFRFAPSFISDFFYDIIAKYRYHLMKQKCKLLTEDEQSYFLK